MRTRPLTRTTALTAACLVGAPARAAQAVPDPDVVSLLSDMESYWTPKTFVEASDETKAATACTGDVKDAAVLGYNDEIVQSINAEGSAEETQTHRALIDADYDWKQTLPDSLGPVLGENANDMAGLADNLGIHQIADWTDPATGLTHTGGYGNLADMTKPSQAVPPGTPPTPTPSASRSPRSSPSSPPRSSAAPSSPRRPSSRATSRASARTPATATPSRTASTPSTRTTPAATPTPSPTSSPRAPSPTASRPWPPAAPV